MAAPMLQKRGALSVTVLGEQLVALGGWDGTGCAPPARRLQQKASHESRAGQTPRTPLSICA